MPAAFLELRGICKSFAGVLALADVSLQIEQGTCHALMGENGAGKSTLGKILAGIHRPDSGTIVIAGQEQRFASPRHALAAGVGMVHQELAFCPSLTVAENLCLGRYPRRWGLLHRAAMGRRARAMLADIGVELDVEQEMRRLSTAQEQLVQIAAAVGTGARILIFDEPTSSLAAGEAQRLFTLIDRLKQRGVTMIYVSHRLPEIFRLCDAVSVLRDGRHVATLPRSQTDEERLVQLMIGRPLADYFAPRPSQAAPVGPPCLEVCGLTSPGKFAAINLNVRSGEIVGLAGLTGAGRSEVAQAIFGLDSRATGQVLIEGEPLALGDPRAALKRGLALAPEDRKRQGLFLKLPARFNFSLSHLPSLRRWGLIDGTRERRETRELFNRLDVRSASIETLAGRLSGGNQQKVVLSRALARPLKLLIIDEPTRGIDVGSKAAIHRLLGELAAGGLAILLISSELPELLHLSSRILVMRQGRLAGELARNQATQEALLRLMAGVGAGEAALAAAR